MPWTVPGFSSLSSLFSQAALGNARPQEVRLDFLQFAMLESLRVDDFGVWYPELVVRIETAPDIQTLWFARDELMSVLACELGEERAREIIEDLTVLFDGMLPEGLAKHGSLRPRP